MKHLNPPHVQFFTGRLKWTLMMPYNSILVSACGMVVAAVLGSCSRLARPPLAYAYEAPIGCGFEVRDTCGREAYVVSHRNPMEVLIPGGDDLINAPSSLSPGIDGVATLSSGDVVLRCTLVGHDGTLMSRSYWILNRSTCTLVRYPDSEALSSVVDVRSLSFADPWKIAGAVILPDP